MHRENTTDVVQRWLAAVVDGPVEDLDVLFMGDASEHKARAAAVRAALDGIKGEVDDLVVEGDRVAWRWTLTGWHTGELAGVAPSGSEVAIRGVNFQTIDGDVVVEHWTTVDLSDLQR
jgi:predicted ester cyclase